MEVLLTTALTKHYRAAKALNGLDLQVSAGMVYGLLGPNGSGKTTALGVVLGVIRPDSGTYTWFSGAHDKNPRLKIGALLEVPNFYVHLNAIENLRIIAFIKRVRRPRIDEILLQVNLFDQRNSPFKTYSLGMKQRLAIAASLIGEPQALIFDEPANGLDPEGIAGLRDTIRQLSSRGKTIILASHLINEVEKLCTHVGIMQKGRLLASGPVGHILPDKPVVEVGATDLAVLRQLLEKIPEIAKIERSEKGLTVTGSQGLTPELLNRIAFQHGIVLNRLQSLRKDLERKYLDLTDNPGP